jgi:hypothetical protein
MIRSLVKKNNIIGLIARRMKLIKFIDVSKVPMHQVIQSNGIKINADTSYFLGYQLYA